MEAWDVQQVDAMTPTRARLERRPVRLPPEAWERIERLALEWRCPIEVAVLRLLQTGGL